jgi:hypothetical protein
VVLTYANSLSGAFVLDDEAAIVQNRGITDLSRLGDVLVPAPDSPIAGRPLSSLSFALNYAAGGLDVRGYHAVNIALHALNALLLWAIVRRTAARGRVDGGWRLDEELIAFSAALLWAVHPLTSEVVDYLTQRTESLMAVCYLLTMYAAIRAAWATQGSRASRGRWEVVAVMACAAGALSKESIATAPLMVALYDRVFLFGSWRETLRSRGRLYGGLALSWLVVGALVASAPRGAVAGFSSGVSPWTYLLNQSRMVTEYLRLIVWPEPLVAFYGWPAALTLPDVAPFAAAIAALLVLSAVALWRWPAFGFLASWFFVTLAPASSLVPVATEVGAERRMYLPLMAIAVLFAIVVDVGWRRVSAGSSPQDERSGRGLLVPLGVVVGVALPLAVVTVARNREYSSPLTLVRTIVERRPTAVAHHMFGEQLITAGRNAEALPHLRDAVAGGNSRAGYQLAQVLAVQGEHEEAAARLEAFIRTYKPPQPLTPRWLEPPLVDVVPARFLLARIYALRSDWPRVIEQGTAILGLVPGHIGARRLLGDAAFAQEQWGAASGYYREYLARQPRDVEALLNYGVTQVAVGNLDEGISVFARAADIEPGNARAKRMLAMAQDDRARLAAVPR